MEMMYYRRELSFLMNNKLFPTIGIILFIDYLTKSKMLLLADNPLWLIPDKLGFHVVFNPGIAFSLPLGGNLAIISSLIIVAVLLFSYYRYTKRNIYSSLGIGMVIGGALGNVFDRFAYGAVVDFIQIYWYPVFNVADIFVCVGFIWILVYQNRIQKV
jgi:signal peptidase II